MLNIMMLPLVGNPHFEIFPKKRGSDFSHEKGGVGEMGIVVNKGVSIFSHQVTLSNFIFLCMCVCLCVCMCVCMCIFIGIPFIFQEGLRLIESKQQMLKKIGKRDVNIIVGVLL